MTRDYVPGVTLLLVALLGHLLHHILALLASDGAALPGRGAGALLVIHILGDGGGHVGADLVRDVIAHLAGLGDVVTNLDTRY